MENHAKYGDTIFYHDDKSLYVNLFIASELNWKEKGLVVRQETRFPEEEGTHLRFKSRRRVKLAPRVRYPSWAQRGITLTINGAKQKIEPQPGSYVTIERNWRSGDIVDVRLPMSLRTEAMPDDPKMVALLCGPIELAGDLDQEGLNNALRYGPLSPQLGRLQPVVVPAFVSDGQNLLSQVKPVPNTALNFRTQRLGQPNDVSLAPFYKLNDHRYNVYWKVYSSNEWEKHKAELAEIAARRKRIEDNTVDFVRIADAPSEREHKLAGEKIFDGVFEGQRWREARDGGWFSYDLKVDPVKPLTLVCRFRGSEDRRRNFDILVEGEKVGSSRLGSHLGEFFDVEYVLPEKLTRDKQRITVKFQAQPNGLAGGVYDVLVARL